MSVSEQTTLAFNARRVATMGDTEAIFRIYIAAGGLFFIRVSGETNTTTAYLVGGVIGLMITRAMNSNKKKVAAKINDMDQKSLRDRLEDSPSNFRVAFEEIENATLNAPSFWNRQGK
ncbi:MAG TPA: hypothetical protein VGZ22_21345, partial [Isosphaeraceae bacterium]|nr:hypothetical protein [Isosphaeraceae bacterium]